ncbi:hypothetical protein TNCV_3355451 [Trichonephila clavipes]|nr:hypothetical protein TNCV_3355451 [Trichonephila clavipes]
MCTNCSSEPATPAHILECLGLTKQDLADVAGVGLSESVRCHGPGLALLTNGGPPRERLTSTIYKIPNLHSHVLLMELVGKKCYSGPKEPQEDINGNRDESLSSGMAVVPKFLDLTSYL